MHMDDLEGECCTLAIQCGTPRVGHKETVYNPNENITINIKITD